MKIAYISSAFLCDCDLPLLREMTNLGHEVVYVLQISPNTKQATLININKLLEEGDVFPAHNYHELEFLSEYIPLERVYVQNMPCIHEWHPASFRSSLKLLFFLKKHHFDVIHLTWPLRYSAFPLYLLRKKMVLTMHDPIPHSSDDNKLNRLHRWFAFKNISRFILLSNSLKDEFIRTYRLINKTVYVSRLGRYEILCKYQPSKMSLPKKYILFSGSINPHKGIGYLCEAMKIVHAKEPELTLVVAGRGKFDFDIDKYVNSLPIILINRFILNEELVSLIKNSSFVVCPYIDATQSGVIMSAFAFNKPVVCTNVGALSEMVQDGRNGLLVSPRNAEELASAILRMDNTKELTSMSRNIDADYSMGIRSWRYIAEETLDIYQQIKNEVN